MGSILDKEIDGHEVMTKKSPPARVIEIDARPARRNEKRVVESIFGTSQETV